MKDFISFTIKNFPESTRRLINAHCGLNATQTAAVVNQAVIEFLKREAKKTK